MRAGVASAGAPSAAALRRCCAFVARVGGAASGSSGHGCFGYLPRISARTDGYASAQKKGRSRVRASGSVQEISLRLVRHPLERKDPQLEKV